ncbi:MAG: MazF family transcriptional regulator [Candidatus Brocadiia bacterium]
MGSPSVGNAVLVKFPFSDLSDSKLRPAIVLAEVGHQDWILSQVTSNPYSDPNAIEITDDDFESGSLRRTSYVRPGKLFSANVTIVARTVGRLSKPMTNEVISGVVEILNRQMR